MNTQSENFEGQIRAKLSRLSPAVIELDNETIHHKGHVGAASGGGHYRLFVVAEAFGGQSKVARHRLVYECLNELMGSHIHALAVQAHTPDEITHLFKG